MKEMLNSLNGEFLHKLEHICTMFKLIGMPIENPKWIQYRGDLNVYDCKEPDLPLELYFKSSQVNHIHFTIDISKLSKDQRKWIRYHYEQVYDHFKQLKYNYLRENQPTITV